MSNRDDICDRCGQTLACHHMGGQEHPFEPEIPITQKEIDLQLKEDRDAEKSERLRSIASLALRELSIEEYRRQIGDPRL